MKKRTISPEYAQSFLNKRGRKVSVEQAALIIEFMYQLAESEIQKSNK